MPQIKEVAIVPSLPGDGPAASSVYDGIIYLSERNFMPLPDAWKAWIYLHEEGHCILETLNEDLCDAYAFYKYAEQGYPLTESIYAITRILDLDNPSHRRRFENHQKRVRFYDKFINNNQNITYL